MKMRKGITLGYLKRIAALVLAVAFMVGMFPLTAKAESNWKWIPLGEGRHQLEGTEVIVKIAPGSIHVTGTGAIPDYGYWDMAKRPWASCEPQILVVDSTITSLGEYAFYDLPKLKYITMSSKTFIKPTTFGKNQYNPIYRIHGTEVNTEMIGTIPYTSLDSIKSIAQGETGAAYVLDDGAAVKAFQESTNPTIANVFIATDAKAPWNDLNFNTNGRAFTSLCRLSPETPDSNITVTGMKRYQGRACYEVFAALIGDYNFISTYQISVAQNDKNKTQLVTTNKPFRYVMDIPKEYQKAGRSFRLLAIGKDQFYNFEDLDAANETITFETNYPSTAYALVYKDVQ